MLVGEPGTAKSMLSELLAAAVSGDSGLTVQGTAGTTEDHLKYSWNYALLLAEGPKIQDVLVSLMSEKTMMIPELGQAGRVYAKAGFNIIATANLRDRGVHEMSSALKRRFNFETVRPIADAQFERELVLSQLQHELGDLSAQIQVSDSVVELLVTVFQELRQGATKDGAAIKTPDAVMSTAEAVNIAHAAALEGYYLGDQSLSSAAIAKQLIGVVLKDNADDAKRIRFYMDNVARERAKQDAVWKAFFEEGKRFWQ